MTEAILKRSKQLLMVEHKDRVPTTQREATARRLRRYRRVRNQLLNDVGGDATQAQQLLAENASALAMWLEERVTELIDGKETALGETVTGMNTLRRLLETLGIERRPRDITTLENYLAERRRAAPTINGSVAQ